MITDTIMHIKSYYDPLGTVYAPYYSGVLFNRTAPTVDYETSVRASHNADSDTDMLLAGLITLSVP